MKTIVKFSLFISLGIAIVTSIIIILGDKMRENRQVDFKAQVEKIVDDITTPATCIHKETEEQLDVTQFNALAMQVNASIHASAALG